MDHRQQIQTLINHIEAHLADDVNIPALAQAAALSPWHFQRLFRSLTGDTLGGYVRGRRLTRAAALLLDSPLGILDIAVEVGFGSHEALTRAFKQRFGLTPKAFRQQRPRVQLQKKPLLCDKLLRHRWQELDTEPVIEQRPAMSLLGISTQIPSPFSSNDSYCHLLEHSWQQLLQRLDDIPGRRPDTFLGLTVSPSGLFIEETLTYLAAVPLRSAADTVPDGMMRFELPPQQVAVFRVSAVDSDTVNKTIDCIYGSWLPNSAYRRAAGHDYEWFEQVQDFRSPPSASCYVIPVTLA